VAIPLLIINALVLQKVAGRDFANSANHISAAHAPLIIRLSIWGPIFVGIALLAIFIVISMRVLSIRQARILVAVTAAGFLFCKSIQVSLAHLHPGQLLNFNLSILIVMGLAPLRLRLQCLIAVSVLAVPWFLSSATGFGQYPGEDLNERFVLISPLTYAALGIAIHSWHRHSFILQSLSEIRLRRQNDRLARQKEVIEAKQAEAEQQRQLAETQRHEAEHQREEAERQKRRVLNLLAGALTRPVAQAYYREGFVRSTMQTMCVIACDAVGFSKTCECLSPESVVEELRHFFRKFDEVCLRVGIEPLRARGDSRLAIAGLWADKVRGIHHAAINSVLAMLNFRRCLPPVGQGEMPDNAQGSRVLWPARIGINLGPVGAGVIDTSAVATKPRSGRLKDSPEWMTGQLQSQEGSNLDEFDDADVGRLWFDVWGDTVNVAARLEQGARTNQILVREAVLWETRGLFDYGPIRPIQVKETLVPACAEVVGIRRQYCDDNGVPNDEFWRIYHATMMTVPPDANGTINEKSEIGNIKLSSLRG